MSFITLTDIIAALAESLAEGAVIVPNIIFAGLLYQHYGEYQFILPFVLLYSFEKAGIFAIQGFGRVNNPYKVIKYGLTISMLGCFLCLFGEVYSVFWEVGAILVGLGLANYNSLFKTIKEIQKEKGKWIYRETLSAAYIILGIIILFILSFRYYSLYSVFSLFLLLLLISYIFIYQLGDNSDFSEKTAFKKKKDSWKHFMFAVCMLSVSFFSRLLKQTADSNYILFIAFALCLLIIVGSFFKSLTFSLRSLLTLWLGATRNFLVVYSLIYFIIINKFYMLGLSYVMIVIGMILSKVLRKKFVNKVQIPCFEIICLLSSMLSLIFLLFPFTYLIGIMSSCTFITTTNQLILQRFLTDSSFPMLERRIIQSKFYNLGAVIQQVILLLTLFGVSKKLNHNLILNTHILARDINDVETTFFFTKLICLLCIWGTGIYLIKSFLTKLRNKSL